MPLNSHSYLVSHGWSGRGTGLRQGAISKPLALPQKRNVAGLGMYRDEATPFWDHLFSNAAKFIHVNILDEEEHKSNSVHNTMRTRTNTFSNLRFVSDAHDSSERSSPARSYSAPPKFSLLVAAKREVAKRALYAKFFRGPVIRPQTPPDEVLGGRKYPNTQASMGVESNVSTSEGVSEKKAEKREWEHLNVNQKRNLNCNNVLKRQSKTRNALGKSKLGSFSQGRSVNQKLKRKQGKKKTP